MEPETTKNIAYIVLGLSLVVMSWYLMGRAKENRLSMLESTAPKIAGEDAMEGGARNPQQFDEPDEDALEEMAKLLGEDEESSDKS